MQAGLNLGVQAGLFFAMGSGVLLAGPVLAMEKKIYQLPARWGIMLVLSDVSRLWDDGEEAMKVICNGEEKEIAVGMRLVSLIRLLGLEEGTIVVECDGRIIGRDAWDDHELQEGSHVELIRFVGGG